MKVDVLIIGGGIAGIFAAFRLIKAGLKIGVIEPLAESNSERQNWGETLRPEIKPIFRKLGLVSVLEAHSTEALGSASAWGSPEIEARSYLNSPYGNGLHIDKPNLIREIRREFLNAGGKLIKCFAKDVGIKHDRRIAKIRHKDTIKILNYDFLIDASGRNRVFSKGKTSILRYDRLVAAAISTTEHYNSSTFFGSTDISVVESVADGWWFTNLTPARQRVFVRFADAGTPIVKSMNSAEGFFKSLNDTNHVGKLAPKDALAHAHRPSIRAASSTRLKKIRGDDWIAIGDAARTVDPLSSQGIFNAASDGLNAAEALLESRSTGTSDAIETFAESVLREYDSFLDTKEKIYSIERRWRDSSFWHLRHP